MSDREEFEKKFPVPENVEFSAKLNKYVWENFPAFTARFNDTWEAFCDGYQTAIESREDGFVRVPVSLIESIRKTLPGCSNHGCAFANRQPGSVGTNGSCNCIGNASRSQLTVLNQRISMLLNAGKEGGA